MNKTMIDHLRNRQAQLQQEIGFLEKRIESAPKGKLRVGSSKGHTQYFVRIDPSDCKGKYLKKSEFSKAKSLAQKEQDIRELENAREEKKRIDTLVTFLDNKQPASNRLIPAKRLLAVPYELSDNEYARQWQAEQYTKKGFKEGTTTVETERGDIVRSKSEAMIANMLFNAGIPYKYERPVRLANGDVFYPDFTILNKRTREVFYFEHFGRMDDPKYRDEFFYKIHQYSINGILIGKNLFVSFEGLENGHGFDGMLIKRLIKECFS